MDAAALRKRITDKLVGDVSETMYPSATMLNRVEAALAHARVRADAGRGDAQGNGREQFQD